MRYLYVANWKMNMNLSKSVNFCSKNHNALQKLSETDKIVLCPSFIVLTSIIEILKNGTTAIGAQNCSEYSSGPYTGEVSAQSLAEIGVTYCIVGHSERRIYYGETSESVSKKINLLYENNIQPIICIGETETEFNNKKTFTVLTQQLEPIIESIHNNNRIIIAYEPVWSIGTGIIPKKQQLQEIFTWLAELFQSKLPNNSVQLLYGGSVNPTNSNELKTISHINGFLIGSASTDFENFTTIITQQPHKR